MLFGQEKGRANANRGVKTQPFTRLKQITQSNAKEPFDLNSDPVGSFALVLHSHIPYTLAHGQRPHGTDWLAEATAETYIPLLDVLFRLVGEGISPQITLGLTPILIEQLAAPDFQTEFDAYVQHKIQMARDNQAEFTRDGDMHLLGLAHYWENFYLHIQTQYRDVYGRDIVSAFGQLQAAGHIEILTSAATHGYLPLLGTDAGIRAQIAQGVFTYQKHFGRAPKGFWLPECGYRPGYAWNSPLANFRTPTPIMRKGLEQLLAEQGLEYFFVDAHLLQGGEAIGVYRDRFAGLEELWAQFTKTYVPEITERASYTPYLVAAGSPLPAEANPTLVSPPNTRHPASAEPTPTLVSPPDTRYPTPETQHLAVFSRDPLTGAQVWSGESGYPGDPRYLEFHKKHYPGHLRYWRVSDNKQDLGGKWLYEPRAAQGRAQEHARHFAAIIRDTLTEHRRERGTPGLVTAMYDTELFGHWWFEGPEFLYHVLKRLHTEGDIAVQTCGAYLRATPPTQIVSLPEGSWGEGGYHWTWLNQATAWAWEKIYEAEREMTALAQACADKPGVERIIRQAARELLLLQSSDWTFNISTYASRDYAEQRINYHHAKFTQLAALARRVMSEGETTHV